MKNSRKILYGLSGALTGTSIILALLYLKEKSTEKKLGGKLVKVNYQFTKDFEV
ncbi:stress-responsive transcriptional regulator PspC [Garciella nitratireducens]|uniref:Uncharacterized protein n=1 Tax=Garciella nitratireducens DSM 15102 TaxID=1121911 RepID=A0A1T4NW18_9FIRM|nr:stress-responsive transcriptional regulator PspC [Garciella nitratireducens]RBP46934.1 hypothetical protein DFR81_101345 [Garciella nitratireducens]SJZ83423.1 hypothetical protein SAMN02745973_01823 [Garciella nitratireducens DSM 15102]